MDASLNIVDEELLFGEVDTGGDTLVTLFDGCENDLTLSELLGARIRPRLTIAIVVENFLTGCVLFCCELCHNVLPMPLGLVLLSGSAFVIIFISIPQSYGFFLIYANIYQEKMLAFIKI